MQNTVENLGDLVERTSDAFKMLAKIMTPTRRYRTRYGKSVRSAEEVRMLKEKAQAKRERRQQRNLRNAARSKYSNGMPVVFMDEITTSNHH